MEFYRFRKISSLLGEFQELENNEIYFASPEELNDPMEGYRDIYWEGDFIAWKNLFRHYLLCLEWMCSGYLIGGEKWQFSEKDIPVHLSFDLYPTDKYRSLVSDIINDFFSDPDLLSLINDICKRTTKIRRDELSFYLSRVHFYALKIIFNNYIKNGMYDKNKAEWIDGGRGLNLDGNFIELLEQMIERHEDNADRIASIFFSSTMRSHQQLNLIQVLNAEKLRWNNIFILFDFYNKYINNLSKLMYSDWFTACFMRQNTNSSVWGNYGDNHTGVCMIFEAIEEDGSFKLPFHCKTGCSSSGAIWGDVKMTLHKINYENGLESTDFFRNLGVLPIPKLNEMWYSDDGEISLCAQEMNLDIDAWRKKYWDVYIRDITVKSLDWEYENEYRVILQSFLHDYSSKNERALKYDFSCLKGIIFGIKTSLEHKVEIIKIIRKKCLDSGRDAFDFYQAYYSPNERKILHYKLGLLKFSHHTDSDGAETDGHTQETGSQ